MSQYGIEICPYCEKPSATDEIDAELNVRLARYNDDRQRLDLATWESSYCWALLYGEGCIDISVEERLIQVLEQRDALAAQLAEKLGA